LEIIFFFSFPGGHQDPGIDQSLLGTALREAHEEVGLTPQQIEYLGSLEPLVSNSGSTLVWPFVVRRMISFSFFAKLFLFQHIPHHKSLTMPIAYNCTLIYFYILVILLNYLSVRR
jgi:8-oxo-dGTP pyrophosphatase MutT (NUDIX family)